MKQRTIIFHNKLKTKFCKQSEIWKSKNAVERLRTVNAGQKVLSSPQKEVILGFWWKKWSSWYFASGDFPVKKTCYLTWTERRELPYFLDIKVSESKYETASYSVFFSSEEGTGLEFLMVYRCISTYHVLSQSVKLEMSSHLETNQIDRKKLNEHFNKASLLKHYLPARGFSKLEHKIPHCKLYRVSPK